MIALFLSLAMNHFIISYITEIDDHLHNGLSGLKTKLHSSVATLRRDLESHYTSKHPTSKVKVLIVEERKVTREEFEEASLQFSFKRGTLLQAE